MDTKIHLDSYAYVTIMIYYLWTDCYIYTYTYTYFFMDM